MRAPLTSLVLLVGTTTVAATQDATGGCARHRSSTIYAVRGRCVAAESGEPLAGCEVRLTGHQSTGYPLSWSSLDWTDPEPVTTGPDGSFRFELRLPASVYPPVHGWPDRIHVRVSHVERSGWFASCPLPTLVDLGGADLRDLKLVLGTRPFLNVVDTKGGIEPWTVVDVQLEPRPPAPSSPNGLRVVENGFQRGRVGADGRVHFESVLQPGKWRVAVEGRELVEGGEIVVPPPPQRPTRCQVVLAPLSAKSRIAGRVVDAKGEGVPGFLVGLDAVEPNELQRGEPAIHQRIGEDGGFAFVHDARSPARPVMMLGASRVDFWIRDQAVEWGDDRVRLVVPSAMDLRLEVVDGEGKPVEDLVVHCVPDVRGGFTAVHEGRRFLAGRVAVPGLRPGAYRLLVYPRDAHLGPSPWQPIEVTATSIPLRIVLPMLARRAVRVLLANGGAARDVRVDLVQPTEGAMPQPWPLAYVLGKERPGRKSPRHDVLLARGWTDKAGQVTLHAAPTTEELALRISGGRAQPKTHVVSGWAAGDEIVIEVEEGVTLSGTVRPASKLDAFMPSDTERGQAVAYGTAGMLPELAGWRPALLVRPADKPDGWSERAFALMPDGSYRIDGLPPGKCVVGFIHWQRKNGMIRSEPVELGEVELRLGEPLRRDFELPENTEK